MSREEKINHIIKTFKNIGPSTAPQILDAGIETLEDLRQIGTEEAFFRIWTKNPTMEINAMYLYALEGAVLGIDCFSISEERKQELKAYTKDMRDSLK